MKAYNDYGYDKWLDETPSEVCRKGKANSTFANHLPPEDEYSHVTSELKWESVYWGCSMAELNGANVTDLLDDSLTDNPLKGNLRGAYNERCLVLGIMHVLEAYSALPPLPRLTAWLSAAGYKNNKDSQRTLSMVNVEAAIKRLMASGLCDHYLTD